MESRQRGNSAGNTNAHLAANLRTARQAVGMDLRTLAERIKATGRMMSPSALSKIENGDRRVDVDDLTVLAYLLQTTPAALLTPPEGGPAPAGVPEERYTDEELQRWVQGAVKLTTEDLLRYWREAGFVAAGYIHRFEGILANYDEGQVGITPREVYEQRLTTERGRLALANGRILQLDPSAVPIPD